MEACFNWMLNFEFICWLEMQRRRLGKVDLGTFLWENPRLDTYIKKRICVSLLNILIIQENSDHCASKELRIHSVPFMSHDLSDFQVLC